MFDRSARAAHATTPSSLRERPIARDRVLPTLRAYAGLRIAEARSQPCDALARIGSLEVRLARSASEVRRAQRLRFQVFYEEGTAIARTSIRLARRDIDAFDGICDHMLVLDHDASARSPRGEPAVVGTYRLLRKSVADRHGGLYTAREFDLSGLLARHPHLDFLELGRSCVLAPYRNKRTVELLWHGIWRYVLAQGLHVMIGCASLEGTDPDRLALPLSFLHHFAAAPHDWKASALPDRYVSMDRLPKHTLDPKAALRELPPLVKGYLRLGAFVGDGAVIDAQFGTTDVLIVLPVSAITERYLGHFTPAAQKRAA